MSEYIGRTVKTDEGNLVIKKAKYTGVGTDRDLSVIKYMRVETECGVNFNCTESALKSVLAEGDDNE